MSGVLILLKILMECYGQHGMSLGLICYLEVSHFSHMEMMVTNV